MRLSRDDWQGVISMLPVLRPYQVEIGKAVLQSVRERLGLTFSIEIARQGGKNELSAQLELMLLFQNMEKGGNIVKCSPTFKPQSLVSIMRLQEKIKEAGMAKLCRLGQGYILSAGRAKIIFYSAEPSSHVMGATAHILLEVDEAQDVDKEKFSRDFKPMASSTNATTVLYGTTWDNSSLLEDVKQNNLELEKSDGIRRHFHYDWQEVAKYNPAYIKYVQSERERLGENHPLFLTQYRLLPLTSRNRFLTPLQLAQLKGEHSRLRSKSAGKVYVAGLDLAGLADEECREEGEYNSNNNRRHDAAALIIAEVDTNIKSQVSAEDNPCRVPGTGVSDFHNFIPDIRIVEILSWTGEPYSHLYATLFDIIKQVWDCKLVAVDATGAGAGVASFLKEALGNRIIPFLFTSQSKSRLGFQLLSFINLGKIKVFAAEGSGEIKEFWNEMENGRAEYRANQTMNFFVDPAEGQDDYLMSLSLAVEAAALYRPRKAAGRTSG